MTSTFVRAACSVIRENEAMERLREERALKREETIRKARNAIVTVAETASGAAAFSALFVREHWNKAKKNFRNGLGTQVAKLTKEEQVRAEFMIVAESLLKELNDFSIELYGTVPGYPLSAFPVYTSEYPTNSPLRFYGNRMDIRIEGIENYVNGHGEYWEGKNNLYISFYSNGKMVVHERASRDHWHSGEERVNTTIDMIILKENIRRFPLVGKVARENINMDRVRRALWKALDSEYMLGSSNRPYYTVKNGYLDNCYRDKLRKLCLKKPAA
jgi:hypothetical protein